MLNWRTARMQVSGFNLSVEDAVTTPDLTPRNGRLSAVIASIRRGLGLELNREVVRAHALYNRDEYYYWLPSTGINGVCCALRVVTGRRLVVL